MARNLILSGGVAHDYARTSPMLANTLREVGIESEVHEGLDIVESGGLAAFDMVTLNCVRWTCSQPQVSAQWREQWSFELSEQARRGLAEFFAQGKGLLALHCATICFDDWPAYRKILGAWWEWGHSGHAPFGKRCMQVHSGAHPVVADIEDFEIDDELYTNASVTDSIDPLIEAEWEEEMHPILWLREYGDARVCYNALGHGPEAFEHPTNRRLLQRGARWVLRELGGD